MKSKCDNYLHCQTWRLKLRKDLRRYMLLRIRTSASHRGFDCDLRTVDDLPPIPSACPVLGIALNLTIGYSGEDHIEVDRIDSSKGYIRGNIRFISRRANRLKSEATPDEHYYLWLDAQSRGAVAPVF